VKSSKNRRRAIVPGEKVVFYQYERTRFAGNSAYPPLDWGDFLMKLEIFYDYTCPYCYLGLHELNKVLADYPQISPAWRPCELNPPPNPKPSGWDTSAQWLAELMPRMERAGLPLNPPHAPGSYSSQAIQGVFWLEEQRADIVRYNDAVYAAVFRDGRDIEDLGVLGECAALAGADAEAFRSALHSEAYRKRRLELSAYGWEENALEAVPSFRLGDARLNAVYGFGVSRRQIEEFLKAHA
jgi:predicted DsbA family dithiol-disulfide isomerase